MFVKNIIRESIEFQHSDGINPLTIGLFLSIIVVALQVWGLLSQNRKINKHKSEDLMPLYFFVCQFFYFGIYVVYGFDLRSLTIIISNLPGIIFLLIIYSLIKCKKRLIKQTSNGVIRQKMVRRLKIDQLTSLSYSIILISLFILVKDRDLLIIIFLAAAISSITPLIYGIIKSKNTKGIGAKYIIAFMASSFIWLVYGLIIKIFWKIDDIGLIISSLIAFLATVVMLIIYKKLNKKKSG